MIHNSKTKILWFVFRIAAVQNANENKSSKSLKRRYSSTSVAREIPDGKADKISRSSLGTKLNGNGSVEWGFSSVEPQRSGRRPRFSCCVGSCRNHEHSTTTSGRQLRFFDLPSDRKMQRLWKEAVPELQDTALALQRKICEEHFVCGRPMDNHPIPELKLDDEEPAPRQIKRGASEKLEAKKAQAPVKAKRAAPRATPPAAAACPHAQSDTAATPGRSTSLVHRPTVCAPICLYAYVCAYLLLAILVNKFPFQWRVSCQPARSLSRCLRSPQTARKKTFGLVY